VSLEVTALRYSYRRHPVLTGVDLSAAEGQLVCLLGANGAGKTTLFRCVLRLLDDYSGRVSFDGTDSRRLSVRDIASRIAYVPQAHQPTFNYSVFETVLMGTNVFADRLRGPRAAEAGLAGAALETMGISHLSDRGFARLSGGERQLVLIARALAQQSAMIVMDEPTANLDYGNQLRVMAQARRLAGQGYLVMLSTHSPQHALLFADTVVVLDAGVVAACGKPGDVITADLIRRIYGVEAELADVATPWGAVPLIAPHVEAEP